MKLQYWAIELDGPDKVGKSILKKYIIELNYGRYSIHDRGYMSQVAYAKKFNREYEYEPDKNHVYILLTCDKKDHDIRCKLNDEPHIDYKNDLALFIQIYERLREANYKVNTFNTSSYSLYELSKNILNYVDKLNKIVIV